MSLKHSKPGAGKFTRAIHGGEMDPSLFGEVSIPIFQTSTFAFPTAEEGAARFTGERPGYIYTRLKNPTIDALERCVADLEGAYAAAATASGMGAVSTVCFALLESGSHVVASEVLYGPSRVLIEREFSRFGVQATFVDTTDTGNVVQALRSNTRLVLLETPANPTMGVTDIQATADIAHDAGVILAVDNTFASPYLQRPLERGADVVIESCTKFLNGHADVVGGMVAARSETVYKRIRHALTLCGGTMDPHQAWLILRGVRTLPLRLERAQDNAMKLAFFLSDHPKVLWVKYPGLPDHPQHQIARKQMDGFGAMLCFGVRNGVQGGRTVMNHVQTITLAVSLGGVESLIEHPASMTHTGLSKEQREKAGIFDELIRLSVGCEDFEDLRDDLDRALEQV
ncbi:MAG: PLP-dependent transferase [Deltaproteobacteria bacterium]|nr:PLP-dependent transferase [Deltaproteobacteria bacterium]